MNEVKLMSDFLESNFEDFVYDIKVMNDEILKLIIYGGKEGKDVCIYNQDFFGLIDDSDDTIFFPKEILIKYISEGNFSLVNIPEMLRHFLTKGSLNDYIYYRTGDDIFVEEIVDSISLSDWELKQLIPILKTIEIFGFGTKVPELRKCNHFDKDSDVLQFIVDVIEDYGYIKFGDDLEIGKASMTKKDFEELDEL